MVGNKWEIENFSPIEAIPTAVGPDHLWRGPEDFTATPLQSLVEQIEAGTMRVTIGRTFKLEQIVEAHRSM